MTDTFEHAPRVWTAGQPRDALSSVPHHTPMGIGVADGPGDFDGYSHYVLVNLEAVESERAGGRHGAAGTRPWNTGS